MILNGIILLDKKKGISSMASDNFIKKIAGTRKVGHSGTLDPFATGLLPVFTGDALKVMRYTDDYDKEYECAALFGVSTTTMDTEGQIVSSRKLNGSAEEFDNIRSAFASLSKITSQIPPSFSAKKINGKKAYEYARQGQKIDLKPHDIKIYSLDLRDMKFEDGHILAYFTVSCSKGTYIRSLCHDAGQITGYGAHALELRRTKAGPFDLRGAFTEENLLKMKADDDYSFVIPRDSALSHLPVINLSGGQFEDIKNGRKILAEPFGSKEGIRCAAYYDGTLSAVIYKEGAFMRIERMLYHE